ncbi:MAG: rod shape-determining protein MreD, partial [Trebonia sp.]
MTSEVSTIRKALTVALLAVALFAAVVIQLTVVNRLPLPGAAAPDLVLLLVTAIAVVTGPRTGAVTGFAGGLALDVAPPATHYAGEYALVFCLAGYGAARLARAVTDVTGERDPVTAFTVMAVAAAAGEAGKAALGLLLSDPDVTGAAVSRLLPGAILYDLLLSPLAFGLVARVTRGAVSAAPDRAPAPGFGRALAPVFRQASAGAAPRLRLAGSGENHANPSPARRAPKLRLSAAHAGTSLRTSAAATPGSPLPLVGGRARRLNFAGNPPPRAPRSTARTPGKNWLRSPVSPAVPAARRAVRAPSRGWLRSAGAGRPAGVSGLTGGLVTGRTPAGPRGFAGGRAGSARATGSPMAGRPARSAAEALAARSAPSGLSALAGAGTPLA